MDILTIVAVIGGVPVLGVGIAYFALHSAIVRAIPTALLSMIVIMAWQMAVGMTPFDMYRAWGDGWLPMIASNGFVFVVLMAYIQFMGVPTAKILAEKRGHDIRPKATSRSSFVVASEFPDRDQEVLKRYRGKASAA